MRSVSIVLIRFLCPPAVFPLPFHANATTLRARALGWPCACVWLPGRWHGVNIYRIDFCGHGSRAWVACANKRRKLLHYTSTLGFGISFSRSSCGRAPRSIFGASEGTLRAGNQGQARRHGGDKIVELVRTVLGVAGDHSGSSNGGTRTCSSTKGSGVLSLLRPPSSWRGAQATFRYATFHA